MIITLENICDNYCETNIKDCYVLSVEENDKDKLINLAEKSIERYEKEHNQYLDGGDKPIFWIDAFVELLSENNIAYYYIYDDLTISYSEDTQEFEYEK